MTGRGRVHPDRIHSLRPLVGGTEGRGPVLYWMSREQRAQDNWPLLHAQDLALELKRPLITVFCLAPAFLGATLRQYDFMLRGLRETAAELEALRIPFVLLRGEPPRELAGLAMSLDAALLVTDFDPLRVKRAWQRELAQVLERPLLVVDGHNVVPCLRASDKKEVGARTLRPKISRLLSEFLEPFPHVREHPHTVGMELALPSREDWDGLLARLDVDRTVAPVAGRAPGAAAGRGVLREFLEQRLPHYATRRNDPNAGVVSGLSPYLHFGQLAPQRAALEALAVRSLHGGGEGDENVQAFLEELVIRRELAENFCHFEERYDCLEAAPAWAQATLDKHRADPRSYVYDHAAFETAATHSPLWNAAQRELLRRGGMHGYMRMYWAKKILEWSKDPETALDIAIRLNDRFQLDGRDPNGYVGVLWSVAGLHDRPWKERPVYGSVRYMNARGCARKFDSAAYIARWSRPGAEGGA